MMQSPCKGNARLQFVQNTKIVSTRKRQLRTSHLKIPFFVTNVRVYTVQKKYYGRAKQETIPVAHKMYKTYVLRRRQTIKTNVVLISVSIKKKS